MRIIGYIIVLILIILDIGIVFNFMLPKINFFASKYKAAVLKENELNLYLKLEKKIQEINLTAEKLKRYQQEAERILPSSYRPEEYLIFVPSIINDFGVSPVNFSFGSQAGGVGINFSFSSSYFDLENILGIIQNSRRILDVQSLSASRAGDKLNVSINVLSPTFEAK